MDVFLAVYDLSYRRLDSMIIILLWKEDLVESFCTFMLNTEVENLTDVTMIAGD